MLPAANGPLPASLPMSPSTPLAAAASELLRRTSPSVLVNHCWRTYVFGAVLLERAGRDVDAECLFVSSCLHDLGLLPDNDDGSTPFQLRGAELARTLVLETSGSPQLAELVHDAVALHLELTTADHPVPEIAGVSLGAAVDVLGLRLDQLPGELVDAALAAHPRGDMKGWFTRAMRHEANRKPDSTVAAYVGDLDFLTLIGAAPFPS
jgi:hypothetical protein